MTEELQKLKEFFYNTQIPTTQISLDKATTIMNVNLFIKSHISFVENNLANSRFEPYLNRLLKLKEILETRTVIT